MYCIIDTETSGLFDFSQPADAEGQPRLASFAMVAADDDLNMICATAVLVKPSGWVMSAEAESVNHLSQGLLLRHGVPVGEVLWRYASEIAAGAIIVAHNAQFDTKMMRAELRRAGFADMVNSTRSICTMKALTPILAIPKANGRGGFKFPRLSEAVELCLGRPHVGAHGALPDALACLDLLRWLKANHGIPAPSMLAAA